MEKKVNRPSGGLHSSNSYVDQPDNTLTFALNTVLETDNGDNSFPSNEEGNKPCGEITKGYTPLGQLYIGDGKTAIWSVSADEIFSEIGVLDEHCNYEVHVNSDALGFRLHKQIDATYRLRRGCQRIAYFVDDNEVPRFYDFDRPENFQTLGVWDASKFSLIRTYENLPSFSQVEVLNVGGELPPGGYNISIRYFDENLNPTEFITTSEIINIYNDSLDVPYTEIEGSIYIGDGVDAEDYRNFPKTSKAIKVIISNLDTSFIFYQLAFIQATSGNGTVTEIQLTETIPTSKDFFIYTGTNAPQRSTELEVATFNNVISSAAHIEQVENKLLLGRTKGKQLNFCQLQKYASRIKTDMITKEVLSNVVSAGNPKSPTVRFEAVGEMPGEIVSYGIVYVFDDGVVSPVFHIPGKNQGVESNIVFSPGENVYPMSNNNESENNTYTENNSCGLEDYWGYDSEGQLLVNQPVRHHRLPLRSDFSLPLVEEIQADTSAATFFQVQVLTEGNIDLSVICDPTDTGCVEDIKAQIQARIEYTVDGVTEELIVNIDPSFESNPIYQIDTSNFISSTNITIVQVEEATDAGGSVVVAPGDTSPKGLTYTVEVVDATFSSEERLYKATLFGLKFSGITIPTPEEIGGETIVGYYIVRNERREEDKTILDSGVLTPSLINAKYIAHGLLNPQTANTAMISKKIFGLIHPEHKFKNRKYPNFTDIKQEGSFDIVDYKYSKARYRDVSPGSGYQSGVHKSGTNDGDGFSLKAITRDNITTFKKRYDKFNMEADDVETLTYLASLESYDLDDGTTSVFNIAADNQVAMIESKEDITESIVGTLPYIYIRKTLADPYATFRTLPYYKVSENIETNETTATFGGDTYISPMRYTNTLFWDNRIAERAGKTSVWNYIIGAIIIVVGVILAFFTGGSSLVLVGAGVALIGAGALFISAGIKRDNLVRAYSEEYAKGLRETLLDDWVGGEYLYLNHPLVTSPADDEIQWIGDAVTNLWFESQMNIDIRYGMTTEIPTFLNAPGVVEEGRGNGFESVWEYFDVWYYRDKLLLPYTKLDIHIMHKLTAFNQEKKDNREYIGHPTGEYYKINPDYERLNSQKSFNHLPLEYDCCSDCNEDFPHRVHYSEESFQEELSDNFRIFKANNYRDIEGETGGITDLFRIKSNLYIHTEESLWHLPQNLQERITNDIVSFIGTGEFFNIPPRKILDENKASGGTEHKWATLKTKYGVFFISSRERKVYKFDGNELKVISEDGLGSWFRRYGGIVLLDDYTNANGGDYLFDNNPSNQFGVGYISVYDTRKERVIFTKQDHILHEDILALDDFELCVNNGQITVFPNFQATIDSYNSLGYTYKGLFDCQMRFDKTVLESAEETREQILNFPNEADIWLMLDMSGSFDNADRQQIKDAAQAWVTGFSSSNPDWTGNFYTYENPDWRDSENWIRSLEIILAQPIYTGASLNTLDIVVISFVNENSGVYHGNFASTITPPTSTWNIHETNFKNLHNLVKSFKGIIYPIVAGNAYTKGFLQHAMAAVKGISYTPSELAIIPPNPALTTGEQDTLFASLEGTNPYADDSLENYGWSGQWDRSSVGTIVITPTQLQEDLDNLLLGEVVVEELDVTIFVPVTETILISGNPIANMFQGDNSWTLSFSLKQDKWSSWHSYLPNFYYYLPEKFYSWKHNTLDTFWKHGIEGFYQNFYGVRYPFILEQAVTTKLKTKMWDALTLHTEARRYNAEYKEFYDVRDITFNRLLAYNSRQSTGFMDLAVKDANVDAANYMLQQIQDLSSDHAVIDRNERDWTINDLRDIRVEYSEPIFRSDIPALQPDYFIDKVLNDASHDINKDWTELEVLRDKFLVVRLIFDKFEDVKLIMNYTIEDAHDSNR